MSGREKLTALDVGLLAEAFPDALHESATDAAAVVLSRLHGRQSTERFQVHVDGEPVLIPARLYFASNSSAKQSTGELILMVRCLQTRSNDGFQRQRALRVLLTDIRAWSAPFVVALIGEYVIEIFDDIHAALSASVLDALAALISTNPSYWELTRQRVISYWNAHYRVDFRRRDYVDALDAAVSAPRST